jgi:HSP20 family protein
MFGLMPYERKGFDLFNAFRDFEKDFFGENSLMTTGFRTDIKDDGNKYILEAELPGFSKEDINIDISNDYLTISAERRSENEEKDKGGRYIRKERYYGSFRRSFDVSNVNTDSIDAEYSNGILKLNLPKKEVAQPTARRLEIK